MQSYSPRAIAFVIALVSGIISAVVASVSKVFTAKAELPFTLIVFLGAFLLMFVLSYLLIRRFLFEKIHPIYKTIHSAELKNKEWRSSLSGKDPIREVSRDVIDWAVNRNREIAQLKQMEKYRREFLGNVSHELKTPIFNIQGYVLTLLDGALEDPSVNRQYLEKTEKSINRMISMVEDLEAIARLESGEMELHFETFNIVSLVEEVFELHEIRAKQQNISLVFDRSYERAVKVFADRKRIFEAISNLVVNSIHYGNPGGKTTVSFLDVSDSYLIDITDTGIGIEEKYLARIFERFYRVDKSRSRDLGGTGLGLSIVKHILEAHSQRIFVKSTPGKGTSFSFTLKKG